LPDFPGQVADPGTFAAFARSATLRLGMPTRMEEDLRAFFRIFPVAPGETNVERRWLPSGDTVVQYFGCTIGGNVTTWPRQGPLVFRELGALLQQYRMKQEGVQRALFQQHAVGGVLPWTAVSAVLPQLGVSGNSFTVEALKEFEPQAVKGLTVDMFLRIPRNLRARRAVEQWEVEELTTLFNAAAVETGHQLSGEPVITVLQAQKILRCMGVACDRRRLLLLEDVDTDDDNLLSLPHLLVAFRVIHYGQPRLRVAPGVRVQVIAGPDHGRCGEVQAIRPDEADVRLDGTLNNPRTVPLLHLKSIETRVGFSTDEVWLMQACFLQLSGIKAKKGANCDAGAPLPAGQVYTFLKNLGKADVLDVGHRVQVEESNGTVEMGVVTAVSPTKVLTDTVAAGRPYVDVVAMTEVEIRDELKALIVSMKAMADYDCVVNTCGQLDLHLHSEEMAQALQGVIATVIPMVDREMEEALGHFNAGLGSLASAMKRWIDIEMIERVPGTDLVTISTKKDHGFTTKSIVSISNAPANLDALGDKSHKIIRCGDRWLTVAASGAISGPTDVSSAGITEILVGTRVRARGVHSAAPAEDKMGFKVARAPTRGRLCGSYRPGFVTKVAASGDVCVLLDTEKLGVPKPFTSGMDLHASERRQQFWRLAAQTEAEASGLTGFEAFLRLMRSWMDGESETARQTQMKVRPSVDINTIRRLREVFVYYDEQEKGFLTTKEVERMKHDHPTLISGSLKPSQLDNDGPIWGDLTLLELLRVQMLQAKYQIGRQIPATSFMDVLRCIARRQRDEDVAESIPFCGTQLALARKDALDHWQ